MFSSFQPTITPLGQLQFGLSVKSSLPCNTLRGVVHSYLQISVDKPILYPVMPDGTQSIFISPHCSIIGGNQSQLRDMPITEAGEYFGIRFYPGALRHFFSLNLVDITDQYVDEAYFPCLNFADLHHNIYRYQGFTERANVCEKWLLQHYKPQALLPFDHALSLIYQAAGNVKIAYLAEETGRSSRHLNRLFLKYTGLNTKTFSKIIRLQQASRLLCATLKGSSDTALDSGFFDQSHLIKDFQQHLLLTPSEFSRRFMSDSYNT